MDKKQDTHVQSTERKAYVKPEAKKHSAAKLVSGSGGCNYYVSSSDGLVYYV